MRGDFLQGETNLISKTSGLIRRFIRKLVCPAASIPSSNAPSNQYQEWSIGIFIGESPYDFMASDQVENPVVTREHVSDVPARFVADPFMLRVDHTCFMFFEVMNSQRRKGEVGLATSENTVKWTYQQIVLREPFHLSYPYVFEWKNEYYMIPESSQTHSVRLYKAIDFPTQWSFVQNLLDGYDFVDSSIFVFRNKCWLFAGLGSPPNRADTLRLYYADDLMGPWFEHRQSPIVERNMHIARPAGRVLIIDGSVIRYAQECYPAYGSRVRAFGITELTTISYHESEADKSPVLTGSDTGWNASGMHHIDPHLLEDGRWIACVDGFMWRNGSGGVPQ
jgi:hypothetical protein